MSSSPCEFTILMPCLNEAATLGRCIEKAQSCIKRMGLDAEILVADNGSTDASVAIAEAAGARVVHVETRGYGAALFAGLSAARGRAIIMGDADDSYDFSQLDAFVMALRRGADLVMGNRFSGGIRPQAMPFLNRYLGNPVLSAIGRLFFDCPARDFHCGLRALTREGFERLQLKTTGMEFASEMVIKATLQGMNIVEVPTTLDPDGRDRPPHLRPWRDGWRHLRFMLLYCPRWLFLYPGLAILAVGASLGAYLVLETPAAVLGLPAVPAMLIAMVSVLIGFQAVAFGFCARIYALEEGLLPADPWLQRLFRFFTLETGLLVGIASIALAVIGASAVARVLSGPELGPESLLWAMASAGAACLGGQVIFTSFLLSFMGLDKR